MIGGLQGDFGDLDIKYLKQNISKLKNCPQKLLCVIKNPVTQYLPVNSRKIGFSYSSEKSIPMRDYVAAVSDDVDLVFVVGAMAHGKISNDYTDDFIFLAIH
ncbi:unnamed protein product, partial [Vitis vinifera]|uniref:Ribosomal RNA small subunit methyltransferase NEP1 n=1 Tax=Vitis vinifera TaxID=29760 RepID=D7T3B4_VITVI